MDHQFDNVGSEGTAAPSHTPGPWTADYNACGELSIDSSVGPGFNRVAVIGLQENCTPEDEANARLIAAAPDLLAALIELVERAEQAGPIEGLPEYDQACAAIARAKGE